MSFVVAVISPRGAGVPRRLLSMLMVCSVLAASGCGGGDRSGSGGSAAPGDAEIGEGKRGGRLSYLWGADVDHLDPGQTYLQAGIALQRAVNRSLYSFSPESGTQPVPDLADGDPQISQDSKTITVHLRKGVRYAPPVDREVRARDVKYAIERAFTTNVDSPYAAAYFAEIEGAPAEPVKLADLKSFPGLQAPDGYTLVIKLTKPVAQRVAAALVMPITVPVPREYAARFDAKSPTQYDRYAAFTGPYMVANDARTGEATGHRPGKEIALVRNRNWDRRTDYRPAFLNRIDIQQGYDDQVVAARRTLSGDGLICCDSGQPPTAVLRRALTRNQDQLGRTPGGRTRWIAMNTTIKPFDNLNLRKAVIAGFDRGELRRTRGGDAVGPIAQSYLPPSLPGHEESGGKEGFDDLDWMQRPDGDPVLARKYLAAAAKEGVPVSNGRYAGKRKLLMVTTNVLPGLATAEAAAAQFRRLGFKVDFRKVPQDVLFTKFCGVPEAEVAICPNVGWQKDFFDAQSMLQPTFDGDAIRPADNSNWSQLDVEAINAAMDSATTLSGGERDQAFADVNRMIVEQAPAIPYSWDDQFQLEASNVQAVMNPYDGIWDLSFASLK